MKLLKNNTYNEYELKHNRASYRTICELYARDMVLCDEIPYVDESVWNNIENGFDEEKDEFSELLNCDVICVDHFGTSWNYVLTDVELVDNYEDLN